MSRVALSRQQSVANTFSQLVAQAHGKNFLKSNRGSSHPPVPPLTPQLPVPQSPLVMGSFEEGERAQSVSQGEGAVVPAPRIRSFPQPQVTWYRDGRKIPPSSRM
ncbi:unnamed protein product [Boreogadus saida]